MPAPSPTIQAETTGEPQAEMDTGQIETGEPVSSHTPTGSAVMPAPFPGLPKEMIAVVTAIYAVYGFVISAMAAANFMSVRFI